MKSKIIKRTICYSKLICPECLRHVPNENWFTKKGCLWCDINYFYSRVKKENLDTCN